MIDEPVNKTASYLEDYQKDARLLFLSVPPDHDQAAILVMNDPLSALDNIKARVTEGFLVRTRADADTVEARAGDYSRMRAAFDSGRILSAPITLCRMKDLRAIIESVSQRAGMLANRRAQSDRLSAYFTHSYATDNQAFVG